MSQPASASRSVPPKTSVVHKHTGICKKNYVSNQVRLHLYPHSSGKFQIFTPHRCADCTCLRHHGTNSNTFPRLKEKPPTNCASTCSTAHCGWLKIHQFKKPNKLSHNYSFGHKKNQVHTQHLPPKYKPANVRCRQRMSAGACFLVETQCG